MPYSTEVMDEGRGIVRIGRGVLKGQEVIQAVTALAETLADPGRVTHGLIDLTEVTDFEVSTAEMRAITDLDRRNSALIHPVFVAIVAPADLAYGMARMYSALADMPAWTIAVFRSMEEARAWLRDRLAVA